MSEILLEYIGNDADLKVLRFCRADLTNYENSSAEEAFLVRFIDEPATNYIVKRKEVKKVIENNNKVKVLLYNNLRTGGSSRISLNAILGAHNIQSLGLYKIHNLSMYSFNGKPTVVHSLNEDNFVICELVEIDDSVIKLFFNSSYVMTLEKCRIQHDNLSAYIFIIPESERQNVISHGIRIPEGDYTLAQCLSTYR